MDISLSKCERLNLYNQYKILEKLYPAEAEYYHRCQEILVSGYAGEYSELIDPRGTPKTGHLWTPEKRPTG